MKLTSLIFSICLVLAGSLSAIAGEFEQLTVRQWVQQTKQGSVEGRVFADVNDEETAVSGATITMTSQDGATLTTKSNADGQFVLSDVQPGLYALTARNDQFFAAQAMHVVDAGENKDVSQEVNVSMASLDFPTVQASIIRYLPPNGSEVSFDSTTDLTSLPQTTSPAYTVKQVDQGLEGFIFQAGVQGSDFPAASDMNVFLFLNGTEVARAATKDDGSFRMDDVAPGAYSLVSIGSHGIGVVGFRLLREGSTANEAKSGKQLIQTSAPCDCFAMQVAPPMQTVSAMQPVQEVVIAEEIVGEPILGSDCVGAPLCGQECGYSDIATTACGGGCGGCGGGYGGGGFGGGGGGGGGFGGGGFGGGGIGTLGALGAALAVGLSDDDDGGSGGVVIPEPASPASP